MKSIKPLFILFLASNLIIPPDAFARGFGGGGGGRMGGGGGGGMRMGGGGGGFGGGGGARPSFGGGGGNFGGGGARPNFGGGGGNFGGGGGARPNFGGGNIGGGNIGGGNFGGGSRPNIGNNSPSFSHPIGGGGSRPNFGGEGIGNRPNIGEGIGNRPNIGGGNFPNAGNRPGAGGAGELRPGGGNNIGQGNINRGNFNQGNFNRGNFNRGDFDRNNFNQANFNRNNFNQNNFNIATNRPYYNNWQHGNWNGNWNRPGGNGYWNGWAHGYYHGYMNGGWGGYWHGGYGGYWGRPWYAAPIAWGLGAWALGSIMYSSGYAAYSNPYYAASSAAPAYYDYSQPITVINQQADPYASTGGVSDGGAVGTITGVDTSNSNASSAPAVSPEIQEGTTHMNQARDAFRTGDYAKATSEIDTAIKSLPKDAALHEFRALIFFATKDYKQAAATLYAVLSAGPGWDWTTLSGMYADVTVYTEQLRALEKYTKENPSAAEARFVLAYHYLTCGYAEAAKKQYQEVLKLQPQDQLSQQLLKLLDTDPKDKDGSAANPTPQPPDAGTSASAATDEQPKAPADIDATKIVGNWTAKRPDGATFTLNITADSKFTWSFTQSGKKQEFGGKYSVDGAILVLERTDGAQMPGLVTMADGGFNFKLYGGPPDDAGLDFRK